MPTSNKLYLACHNGQLKGKNGVINLFNQGYNIDQPHPDTKLLPIYMAAREGHLEIVKFLISKNAKIGNSINARGNLLYWICQCKDQTNQTALLAYLLENKNIEFEDHTTKEHIDAARSFEQSAAERLANIVNDDGLTPLYYVLSLFNDELLDLPCAASIESFIKPPQDPLRNKSYLWHLKSSLDQCGKFVSDKKKIKWYTIAIPALDTFIKKCSPELAAEYQSFLSTFYDLWVNAHLALSARSADFENAFEYLSAAMTIMINLDEQTYPWIGQRRDDCLRRMAQLYLSSGGLHEQNNRVDEALQYYSEAVETSNQVLTKTTEDENFIDQCYRCYFVVYVKLGNQFYNTNTNARHYFLEAIKYSDMIQQKDDDDLRVVCGNPNPDFSPFERLAELDLMSPSTQENAKSHYQIAIEKLYAIQVKKSEDYYTLARYYQHLNNPCLLYSLEWSFTHFATLSLSRDIVVFPQHHYHTLPTFFATLYKKLKDQNHWHDAKILIPSMIQLMQLLLQEHHKAGFPNNTLSRHLVEPNNYKTYFACLLESLRDYYHVQTEKENIEKNRITCLEQQVNSLRNQLDESNKRNEALEKSIETLKKDTDRIIEELAHKKRQKTDENSQTDEAPKTSSAPILGQDSPLNTTTKTYDFPGEILAQASSPPTLN